MAKTRDGYRVTAHNLDELITAINFVFARISDRLDKNEGIRGDAVIESSLTVGSGSSSQQAAQLADLSRQINSSLAGYARKASPETISGSWTFSADQNFQGKIRIYDSATSTIIHSMD